MMETRGRGDIGSRNGRNNHENGNCGIIPAMKIGLDFSQRYYPRSFLSLLLLAFALVAAPLIVAFYNAAVYVEQLADQSQTAVSQAAQDRKSTRLNSSHVRISY